VSAEDVDRIRQVNAAVMARDMDTVSERLHPDVVWEHNLGGGSPEEGVYRGRESVIALLERILEAWEYMRSEPREIRDLGGGAYHIRGELHVKHSTSATEMVEPFVQRFELHDGLLLRAQMTTGTVPVRERENVDVVRQVVEAFRQRDVPLLRSLFDEQSEFTSAEGGTYRGLDEIERYMRDLDGVFEDWRSENERYVDACDGRVVLVYRIVGRGRGSGVPVDQEIAILWTVRDRKVLRGKAYVDPEEALLAVGVREAA